MAFKPTISYAFGQADKGWDALRQTVRDLKDGDSFAKVGIMDDAKDRKTIRIKKIMSYKKWLKASPKARGALSTFNRWKHAKNRQEKKDSFIGPRQRPLTNAQIAAVHEFGAPDKGIPERSFIRSTFELQKQALIAMLVILVRQIYERKISIEKTLNILGLKLSTEIKKRVTTGAPIPPQNSAATIRRKTEKGQHTKSSGGLVRTLVDTGQMIRSVTWRVVLRSREPGNYGDAGGNVAGGKPK